MPPTEDHSNSSPVFAAIDAGSNGIRLAISRADSPESLRELKRMRCAVRLGHNAFTRHEFDRDTMERAVAAFALFRESFDELGVAKCRAVATSAAREASNSGELVERLLEETGIRLEIIDGDEEARLVRAAVLARLGSDLRPDMILDLGGGSLEVNLLHDGELRACRTLPLGTVRLMESHGIKGPISAGEAVRIAQEVGTLLERHLPEQADLSAGVAAACGGNVESLAALAPGVPVRGMGVMEMAALEDRLEEIIGFGVKERMKAYDVREDRAEVMGVAAIVLVAASVWLRAKRIIVPGVGVREGILQDLVASHFHALRKGAVA